MAGFLIVAAWLAGLAPAAWADLGSARAEPNLEKRSRLALDNAFAALKHARHAYRDGDQAKTEAAVQEIRDSVDMAHEALKKTGKDPRRSPKWFKRAEILTRDLVRRLEAFELEMSFDDRAMVKPVRAFVQETHDQLLQGLMEGRRK